eukprot:gene11283-18915_t
MSDDGSETSRVSSNASFGSLVSGLVGSSYGDGANRVKGKRDSAEEDLLEEEKSISETIFATMWALTATMHTNKYHYTYVVVKLFIAASSTFLLVFNPYHRFGIDTSNGLWKVFRWLLPRLALAESFSYHLYIGVMYFLLAWVYAILVFVAWLGHLARQQKSDNLKVVIIILEYTTAVTFDILFVIIMDIFAFTWDCRFTNSPPGYEAQHYVYEDVDCLALPHAIHMSVAGFTQLVYSVISILHSIAGSDLGIRAKSSQASAPTHFHLRAKLALVIFIIACSAMDSVQTAQALVMTLLSAILMLLYFWKTPFYKDFVNNFWFAVYNSSLFLLITYIVGRHWSGTSKETLTANWVLYGIWPVWLGSAALMQGLQILRRLPVRKFRAALQKNKSLPTGPLASAGPSPNGLAAPVHVGGAQVDVVTNFTLKQLQRIHRFGSPDEVEVLSRVTRKYDEDGMVDKDAAILGDLIIKAGLATFPNNTFLLIFTANFLLEIKEDGPASRNLLQQAAKNKPSFVDRYLLFSTSQNNRRLAAGEKGTLDLQQYVVFKQNYKMLVRAFEHALQANKSFWKILVAANKGYKLHFRLMTTALYRARMAHKHAATRCQLVMDRFSDSPIFM